MKDADERVFSTGLEFLDDVLHGPLAGDSVVWQVDKIDDYMNFTVPFGRFAMANELPLVYFRFAEHERLLPGDVNADVCDLDAHAGFEAFVAEILAVIERLGRGVNYIFDSLSELPVDWYSDRMLGNFFMLVSPHLSAHDSVGYFSIVRNKHSVHATDSIHNTARIVLDVYKNESKFYVHPIKVENRHSPTMYMLHVLEADACRPVLNSAVVSEILASAPQPWVDFTIHRLGEWTSVFLEAEKIMEAARAGEIGSDVVDVRRRRLIKMAFTRDERMFDLAMRYLDLEDLLGIRKRMIGTGLIGGKSAGMIMARAILAKTSERLRSIQEAHDSFFIGSDVFVTFLVENGCWKERRKLTASDDSLDALEAVRWKILSGRFPTYILEQFKELLNYFGQSPIIVRSSSLLEDAYGNAFSGKYESVFCANQGSPEDRLEKFIEAIRTVYASTVSRDAIAYREHNDLLEKDEQMALLVQRVSGEFYDNIYFPHLAGVAYSFNPFVWNKKIKAEEGVLRLVFGLGTHAVDRVGDDYTRVVAVNEPLLRPENSFDAVSKYSQKRVDVLDLRENAHATWSFESVFELAKTIPWRVIASRNEEMDRRAREMGLKNIFSWMLTFDELLSEGSFVDDMREVLKTLEMAYSQPVDIEFAVNFVDDREYRVNLLQCRPFQIPTTARKVESLEELSPESVIMRTDGPFIGQSVYKKIDAIIYVRPEKYAEMSVSQRYSAARLIGELSNSFPSDSEVMLIGPGRWGTTMPQLGVPVAFNEIRNASVLCELVMMHEGLVPDFSLGTHFFNDLVEMNTLYMAFFPDKENYSWDRGFLETAPSALGDLTPSAKQWDDSIRVLVSGESERMFLHVDTLNQKGVLFRE